LARLFVVLLSLLPNLLLHVLPLLFPLLPRLFLLLKLDPTLLLLNFQPFPLLPVSFLELVE
jgi:hypothetical protein